MLPPVPVSLSLVHYCMLIISVFLFIQNETTFVNSLCLFFSHFCALFSVNLHKLHIVLRYSFECIPYNFCALSSFRQITISIYIIFFIITFRSIHAKFRYFVFRFFLFFSFVLIFRACCIFFNCFFTIFFIVGDRANKLASKKKTNSQMQLKLTSWPFVSYSIFINLLSSSWISCKLLHWMLMINYYSKEAKWNTQTKIIFQFS